MEERERERSEVREEEVSKSQKDMKGRKQRSCTFKIESTSILGIHLTKTTDLSLSASITYVRLIFKIKK